ncbi:hypothetical protein [Inquilinus limosus]|uniref:Uncharacterized protein n=1 Tax=Inquilinus limosus TaxID=171674 RepID=A0A211YVL5_9PROT|nr:hypothetical protein [Inquilinus limosus]OWJ57062.1 hypothetical protein BWR60_34465 [Inquilinus limosus]
MAGHVGRVDVTALEKFLADAAIAAPSRYAFVRRGKVICFYADSAVALEVGAHCFPDREFSIIDVQARKLVLPH